ncbi:LamG domain-containing protein [Phytohabitans suffuscus]|uniref:LamG-like jellyroll fold domain-containing protein n=1 Tax=Phytohabitans suffuscus TaxID=624315 RepID=A0A6F8YCR4_9ACTN|nr:LamG domain-containing protein [Phytohabitans suffuscus]BCB83924.1 hypothetical protein Psuf_012370 [Phytohabitans suffuscus]
MAAAVLTAGLLSAPGSAPAGAAPPACAGVAPTEAAAVALATSCGEPVVADASRTEFTQVVAQPDGRLRFESAVEPQRARTARGWAEVDLGLGRSADGRWRPSVSVADVAFSGGGTGPLVTLVRGGRTLTMSWPGSLPAPVVSGDSVTYPSVMSDVDLVVRATRAGFAHTLVVKTAAAAANPAVRQIRFGLGGDLDVRTGAGGGLEAVAGGAVVASAEPAVMWDSRAETPATGRALAGASGRASRSTAAEAGDLARVAPVTVAVAEDGLVLRPDPALLKARDAVFPLFVDPTWSVFKYKWAYATNTGNSNSDHSAARVGKDPNSSNVYRSFFQFSTTAGNGVSLKYKHIESARVEMNLDHSASCGPTVASMYRTPSINSVMQASWSAMQLTTLLATASGNANEAGGCGSIQGDMIMNFQGATVTNQMQTAANGAWGSIAFGFTARDGGGAGESTEDRWKKFHPNDAKLFVDYDSKPGPPNGLQVHGVACPASGVLTVGTLTPTFSAVFPDADGSADSLIAQFEWIEVPAGGMGTVTATTPARRTPPPNKTGVTPNSRTTSASVTIVTGRTYAYRARSTDKPPYSLTGDWSVWCQFAADTSKPPVSAAMVTTPSGPGLKGRVRFESTATDVTKFRYGWDDATKEVTAQGTNPKWAEVDVTAQSYGRNVLWVQAVDATGNLSNKGSAEFAVGKPSEPVAKWGLETYPGETQADALADQQAAGGSTPLVGTLLSWIDDARLLGGQTVRFNGGSSQAVASGLTMDTTASFSVAAWVRMDDVAGYHTFLSKDAGQVSTFRLQWVDNGVDPPRWCFRMATSLTTPDSQAICSQTPAVPGRWTHVAGSYDKAEGKIRLWVDGQHAALNFTTPVTASGSVVLGRALNAGAPSERTYGEMADVQIFDRVLVTQDFVGQVAADPYSGGFNRPGMLSPIPTGSWDFEGATSCYLADLRDTCEALPGAGGFDRWLALTRGAAVGAGHSASDNGLWLDNAYFPDEGFSETTQEYGRSAYKTGLTPPDGDGLEYTIWQDTPALYTDQSFTMAAWVMLDSLTGERTLVSQRGAHESGGWLKYSSSAGGKWRFTVSEEDATTTDMESVTSEVLAEEGVWTHVAGVYDAARSELRIYVNGEKRGTQTIPFTPMASSGPLLVGRTFWHDQLVDPWIGAIDDVTVFQGAMTDAAVGALHDPQSVEPE